MLLRLTVAFHPFDAAVKTDAVRQVNDQIARLQLQEAVDGFAFGRFASASNGAAMKQLGSRQHQHARFVG